MAANGRDIPVVSIRPSDAVAASKETLALAMEDDPTTLYYGKASQHHKQAFWRHLAGLSFRCLPRAQLFLTTADCQGVALWYQYPQDKTSTLRLVARGGLVGLVRHVAPQRWLALLALGGAIDARKDAFARTHGPFLYLYILGVRPQAQGRGLGSRLIRHVTALADQRGQWCYLEATTERNRALYQRHAFRQTEVLAIRPDAPPLYIMHRPPQPPAAEPPPKACCGACRGLRPLA